MHAEECFIGPEVEFLASLSLSKDGSQILMSIDSQGGLVKAQLPGQPPEVLLEEAGEACVFTFLASSQAMPLMLGQGPHLENCCSALV